MPVAPDTARASAFAAPPSLRRLLVFALVFLCLQAVYEAQRGSSWDRFFIGTLTVASAAAVVGAVAPELGAHAQGEYIVGPAERLRILPGCEGGDALLLLAAAMLCAGQPCMRTLRGLAWGVPLVHGANVLRVALLYVCAAWDHALFAFLHAYVAPIAVIGVALLYFALWSTRRSGTP